MLNTTSVNRLSIQWQIGGAAEPSGALSRQDRPGAMPIPQADQRSFLKAVSQTEADKLRSGRIPYPRRKVGFCK